MTEKHDEMRETIVVQEAVTRETVMWRLPFDVARVYEDEITLIRHDVAKGRLFIERDEHGIFARVAREQVE
jgi:hypothetical protein